MTELHKKWMQQCEAAETIEEKHGTRKALGYLIGEKLTMHVEASDMHPEFREELPRFVAKIKEMFDDYQIQDYLSNVRMLGAIGHICSGEEQDELVKNKVVTNTPEQGAKDAILFERIKELLEGPTDG